MRRFVQIFFFVFFLFLSSLIITGFINKKSSMYCLPTVLLRSYRYRCIIPKLVPYFCPEKINQPIGVLRNPGIWSDWVQIIAVDYISG